MLFKMIGIEKSYLQSDRHLPRPRQVFVTKSRMLADKVEDYLMKLLSATLSASDVEDFAAVRRWARQGSQGRDMVNAEDDEQWRLHLPRKFSDLGDEHFPLTIPYDTVSPERH